MSNIKIVSLNANGLNADLRRTRVLTWARCQKIDILLLQETHTVSTEEYKWYRDWEGDVFFSHGTTNSRGVAILISQKLKYDLVNKDKDSEGRMCLIEISVNDQILTLCNIYGFNDDIPEFFEVVIKTIESYNYENLIWGGDFNVVLNVNLDKKGGIPKTHENSKNYLNYWQKENEVCDIWRVQHPTTRRYTWHSNRRHGPLVHTRLDFFLISNNMATKIKTSDTLPGFGSDHAAPALTINLTKKKGGRGFWKLNTSLLAEEAYREIITNCIEQTIKGHILEKSPTVVMSVVLNLHMLVT